MAKSQPRASVGYSFTVTNPMAATAADMHAAAFVTAVTRETRKAISQIVAQSFTVDRMPPRDIAKLIRPMIGLTARQARSVMAARAQWEKSGLTGAKLQAAVERLAAKKLKERSLNIARTESIRAANAGQLDAWQRAADTGLLVPERTSRQWLAAGDVRTCPTCSGLDGETVAFDAQFSAGIMAPPAHPSCRCSVALVIKRGGRTVKARSVATPANDARVIAQDVKAYPPAHARAKSTLERYRRDDGTLTPERQSLHDAIVRQHLRGATPTDSPTTVIMGGGPASGKSVLRSALDDLDDRVLIDPDEIRALFPEYKAGIAKKQANVAAYTHEEASLLAKRIVREASGYHRAIDGTGDSSIEHLAERIANYRANGSKVIANYVTVDVETAVARAYQRGLETGRFVPEVFMREVHAGVSRVVPEAIKRGLFDEFVLWDTSGKPPIKVASAKGTKLTIYNRAAWKRFLAKGKP
jgi:SPP1 gp7 family putative phage head morphogenesis protein